MYALGATRTVTDREEGDMRIIAGTARGRSLKAPSGHDTRPTSDRVRETIFNVLGQWCDGERVLDLYAGLGGLGLEALSRGAEHATFVESSRHAMPVLADNVRTLGFADRATTLLMPAERALSRLEKEGRSFSLVFSDPPYALHAGTQVLEALTEALLPAGGRAVIEHDRRELLPEQAGGLTRVDERRFGDTVVSFYERS